MIERLNSYPSNYSLECKINEIIDNINNQEKPEYINDIQISEVDYVHEIRKLNKIIEEKEKQILNQAGTISNMNFEYNELFKINQRNIELYKDLQRVNNELLISKPKIDADVICWLIQTKAYYDEFPKNDTSICVDKLLKYFGVNE
jgi:hypothetical protein